MPIEPILVIESSRCLAAALAVAAILAALQLLYVATNVALLANTVVNGVLA